MSDLITWLSKNAPAVLHFPWHQMAINLASASGMRKLVAEMYIGRSTSFNSGQPRLNLPPNKNLSLSQQPSMMDAGHSKPDDPETFMSSQSMSTRSNLSNMSDGLPSRFASLLTTITPRSLIALAVRIRYTDVLHEGLRTQHQRCIVIQPPKYGAFNLLYTVEFGDGARWLVRIPCPGENGRFTATSSRSIRSEAYTMAYLRRNTSIPIPEIHGFDETTSNEVGAPYIMMEFVNGFSVDELWFDETGPTPLPLRRIRILKTLAEAMSQLSKFQFDEIGALQFDPDNTLDPKRLVEFNVTDESVDLEDMMSGVDKGPNFRKIGPFDSSFAYFEALLAMQPPPRDHFSIGLHHLLKMMIRCLPPSIATRAEPCPESFVFAHPDLDCQNVLVSEDGTLAALIDWDNVHTVPRCVGYSRYPSWITRDWDPMKYGYQVPGCRP